MTPYIRELKSKQEVTTNSLRKIEEGHMYCPSNYFFNLTYISQLRILLLFVVLNEPKCMITHIILIQPTAETTRAILPLTIDDNLLTVDFAEEPC